MKSQWISISTVCCIVAIAFFQLANSGGPNIDASGSPFDSGQNSCTQCHGGTLNGGTGSISLGGISAYYPGSSYSLTITVSQPSPTAARYGFQMIGLTTGNAEAGDFTAGTGSKTQMISGREYIEQNSVFNSTGTWTFDWEADAATTGDVTFYFGGNAANGNGSTSGDQIYSATLVIPQTPVMTYNGSGTAPTCNGACDGTATITVQGGGVPPYTYAWNDPSSQTTATATGLCSGTYTVTITDADGNTETEFVALMDPTAIALTSTSTPSTCVSVDGSATVTATGGVAGFTYLWNDPSAQTTATANNLAAGTYTVIVTDANGCTATETVQVMAGPSGLTNMFIVLNASCNTANGSISSTPVGGVPPFSFLWSNGQTTATASNLAAGTYTVTVTDANGCSEAFSDVVQNDDGPVVTGVPVDANCAGEANGSIDLTVTGGAMPYTFAWEDGNGNSVGTTEDLANVAADSYTVIVTDQSGCTQSMTFDVVEPAALALNDTTITEPTDDSTCDGAIALDVTGGTGAYTYAWSDANNQTTATATDLCAGIYAVTITDANGCELIISDLTVDGPFFDGLTEVSEEWDLKIWPNPTDGQINLRWDRLPSDAVNLELLDLTGKVASTLVVPAGGQQAVWDVSNLGAGMYLLRDRDQHTNQVWRVNVR